MHTNKLKIKRCKKYSIQITPKRVGRITTVTTMCPTIEHLSTGANNMRSESRKLKAALLETLNIRLPTMGRSSISKAVRNCWSLKHCWENRVDKYMHSILSTPGQGAQLVTVMSHSPKGCGFDSWAGHKRRLWVRSPPTGTSRRKSINAPLSHWYFSFFLPSFSNNPYKYFAESTKKNIHP